MTKLLCYGLHTSLSPVWITKPSIIIDSAFCCACILIIAGRSRPLLSPHYNPRPTHLYGNNSYPSAAKLWRVFYLASGPHHQANIKKHVSRVMQKANSTQSVTGIFYRFKDAIIREFLLFLCQKVYGSFFAAIFRLTNTATVFARNNG